MGNRRRQPTRNRRRRFSVRKGRELFVRKMGWADPLTAMARGWPMYNAPGLLASPAIIKRDWRRGPNRACPDAQLVVVPRLDGAAKAIVASIPNSSIERPSSAQIQHGARYDEWRKITLVQGEFQVGAPLARRAARRAAIRGLVPNGSQGNQMASECGNDQVLDEPLKSPPHADAAREDSELRLRLTERNARAVGAG